MSSSDSAVIARPSYEGWKRAVIARGPMLALVSLIGVGLFARSLYSLGSEQILAGLVRVGWGFGHHALSDQPGPADHGVQVLADAGWRRRGGAAWFASLLHLGSQTGVTLAVVRKLRLLFWSAVGLALLGRERSVKWVPA